MRRAGYLTRPNLENADIAQRANEKEERRDNRRRTAQRLARSCKESEGEIMKKDPRPSKVLSLKMALEHCFPHPLRRGANYGSIEVRLSDKENMATASFKDKLYLSGKWRRRVPEMVS